MLPRPCSPNEAVARALRIIVACIGKRRGASYQLGTGDYRPAVVNGQLVDSPWSGNPLGSDCAGFAIAWCYKLPRHRPGGNVGSWATVSDDLNVDSACEDADHGRDLFAPVTDRPAMGDLICYQSARHDEHGPTIGHVGIVVDATGAPSAWSWEAPRWDTLVIAQCHGPNGFTPAVVKTDGSVWAHHDAGKPTHRSRLLRCMP